MYFDLFRTQTTLFPIYNDDDDNDCKRRIRTKWLQILFTIHEQDTPLHVRRGLGTNEAESTGKVGILEQSAPRPWVKHASVQIFYPILQALRQRSLQIFYPVLQALRQRNLQIFYPIFQALRQRSLQIFCTMPQALRQRSLQIFYTIPQALRQRSPQISTLYPRL